MEGVHFPWRTGLRGDFIGKRGAGDSIPDIYSSEPAEEASRKFYNDTVAWLRESGLSLKIEGSDLTGKEIDAGKVQRRFYNTYKLEEGKKRKDVFVGWRSDEKASFRTPDGVYTVDVGHPNGNVKFKFIHVVK